MRSMLLCLAALSSACSASVPTRVVYGRYEGLGHDVFFARALQLVQDAGYVPEHQDPSRGRVILRSRSMQGARFVLQLYEEGWVQLRLSTGRGTEPYVSVSPGLANEYRGLAHALDAGFERARDGEGGS